MMGRAALPEYASRYSRRDHTQSQLFALLILQQFLRTGDPGEAGWRLYALETAEGGPKGARRALSHGGPELRGKTGWFASGAAKAERDEAVRLRESEERTGAAHVRSVEWQRSRDAV